MTKEDERTKMKLTFKMFCCPESSASKPNRSQDHITSPPGKRISTKDRGDPSTSGSKSSNIQRGDKAARNTHSALSNGKKKTDHVASTRTTLNATIKKRFG